MRFVSVDNISQPDIAPLIAGYADSFFSQLRGLTFRRSLGPQEGLLLVQTRDSKIEASIHMLGVFMNLSIFWITSSGKVVDKRLAEAWRPLYIPSEPCRYVLETHPDRMADFNIGDMVRFNPIR
jgi:uncharacterized membrane protein (UPF0127 family)